MSVVFTFIPQLSQQTLPLLSHTIPAGFPSPAEEYLGDTLDLNAYIVKNPVTTFFARVDGDSMRGVGIFPNDIVVVDKSIEAKHGDIVIAVLDGEMTIKQLSTRNGIRLIPRNKNYSSILINTDMDFSIWGVVTFRIGKL